ncbi:MAG: hypothetical protein E2O29_02000 [Deltaproteobacteria bacterium]|nr:MAG: hypothetical protein E2O29_02000 [Deltaproteobacteria bacterium]
MSQGFTGSTQFVTVREEDGSPVVSNVSVIRVTNGKLTDQSGGQVSLDLTGTPLTVKETDGAPNVSNVTTINVTNGKLTDDGGGVVTIDVSGASAFNDLSDVTLTSVTTDDFLRFNGSVWINDARQTAVNKITDVAGATNEQILTKDTGTGNAIFKDAPAAGLSGGETQQFTNLIENGNFSQWGNGTSVPPDALNAWTLLDGGSVSQESGAGNVLFGEFSLALLSDASGNSLSRFFIPVITTSENTIFRGRDLTFSCWIRATAANAGRLLLGDSGGSSNSPYHTGGGAWEFISVTRTIDASATNINLRLTNDGNTTTVYFDGMCIVDGDTAISYAQHPYESVAKQLIQGWIHYDQASGTATLVDSYNVSSITDRGTGEATINWDIDFADANYVIAGTGKAVGYVTIDSTGGFGIFTDSVDVSIRDNNGSESDRDNVGVMAVGNH